MPAQGYELKGLGRVSLPARAGRLGSEDGKHKTVLVLGSLNPLEVPRRTRGRNCKKLSYFMVLIRC